MLLLRTSRKIPMAKVHQHQEVAVMSPPFLMPSCSTFFEAFLLVVQKVAIADFAGEHTIVLLSEQAAKVNTLTRRNRTDAQIIA